MIVTELKEIELIVFEEDEEDINEELEDLKAYAKTYEHDTVAIHQQERIVLDEERIQYNVVFEISRDSENLGRKYTNDEQKIFGFES